jgi:selenocysteine-specific elongation factor
MLHVGAVALAAYLRPLGGDLARLVLPRPLPLRVGDRMLLRDPGRRLVWGVTALDPSPPTLRRRGAARERAGVLAGVTGTPDPAGELARRGVVHRDLLRRIGVPPPAEAATTDGWLLSPDRERVEHARLVALVRRLEEEGGLDSGTTPVALADRLGLPSPRLVEALVRPPLRLAGGRVTARAGPAALPASVEEALASLADDLESDPFAAPTAGRLRELGLDPRAVTLAARAGRLLHLGDGVVLLPGADEQAAVLLAELPQPFTTSEARGRLRTSRRVALPLLSLLDRQGRTHRLPDDRRTVRRRG